jgi:putative DNA primase/helicase
MIDLRSIARALGGEVNGRQVLAPGPGHLAHDRSLAVRPQPSAPDGFLVYSHAGDDWRECRDYVRERLGLPAWQPGDERHDQRKIPRHQIDKWDFNVIDNECEDRQRTEDDQIRINRAIRVWDGGTSPVKTAAEDYLRSRALILTDELAGHVLRFNARCPWRDEKTGQTVFIPCLVAAFRSIDDDIITAVHRIRLDRSEQWPKTERRMLGVVHRAAVKLGPVGNKLTIGEGIETCMAAQQLGLAPVWALGSAGAISFFPLLDEVRELTILAEADATNSRNIKICGRRWKRTGRRVLISRSNVGSDHNDALMRRIS